MIVPIDVEDDDVGTSRSAASVGATAARRIRALRCDTGRRSHGRSGHSRFRGVDRRGVTDGGARWRAGHVGPRSGIAAPPAGPVEVPDPTRRRRRARRPRRARVAAVPDPVYAVPDLVGVEEPVARNQITGNGWEVSVQHERSDVEPRPGHVIRTAPAAGEELTEGEPFLLIVSDGPLFRELPELTGRPYAERCDRTGQARPPRRARRAERRGGPDRQRHLVGGPRRPDAGRGQSGPARPPGACRVVDRTRAPHRAQSRRAHVRRRPGTVEPLALGVVRGRASVQRHGPGRHGHLADRLLPASRSSAEPGSWSSSRRVPTS